MQNGVEWDARKLFEYIVFILLILIFEFVMQNLECLGFGEVELKILDYLQVVT